MIPSLKKRFWKKVTIQPAGDQYQIYLDDFCLSTPAKNTLEVPTKKLAQMVAKEWDQQKDEVKPFNMPATRAVNATLDKVSVNKNEIIDMLTEYGGADLLCYRADAPRELAERQIKAWDPILQRVANQFDAPLNVTNGVMFVTQVNQSLVHLKNELKKLTIFELTATHDLVTISGSLVLALAVISNHIDVKKAWSVCRIDDDWQKEQWGKDEDAEKNANLKQADFIFAYNFFKSLK